MSLNCQNPCGATLVPSILDGTRVDPVTASLDEHPSKSIYEEYQRQFPTNRQRASVQLICEPSGRELSYQQLDVIVKKIADAVSKNASDGERPITVLLPPGAARIASLLALNYLGLAFVPIECILPAEQRKHIIEHSNSQLVITNAKLVTLIADLPKIRKLVIDEDGNCVNSDSMSQEKAFTIPPDEAKEDKVALILYTSGSTGVPKGAMLTNANWMNRLRWHWAKLPNSEDGSEVYLLRTSALWVDSYIETLPSILRFQRIVIADPNRWKDSSVSEYIAGVIEKHNVTRLQIVPSLLRAILDEPDASKRLCSLRVVICTGECLPPYLAKQFFRVLSCSPNQPRLLNLYGSTETTCDVTGAIFTSEADVNARIVDGFLPVGSPLFNTSVYVFKQDSMDVAPIGEIGRVFASGDNICKGYVGVVDVISRNYFMAKPENLADVGRGDRLYEMGDLGRVVPGGDLVVSGRNDSIAKISGIRVSCVAVQEALENALKEVASKKPTPNGKIPICRVLPFEHKQSATNRLAGFYEIWTATCDLLNPIKVRNELRHHLPAYAVPEVLFPMEMGSFPLQPHTGKIELRTLKRMAEQQCEHATEAADAALLNLSNIQNLQERAQEAVRLVVASSLGLEAASITMGATFFDQGGSSLTVIVAVTYLQRIGYDRASVDMFLTPNKTLEAISQELLVSQSKSDDHGKTPIPDWLEFRDFLDLNEEEVEIMKNRLDVAYHDGDGFQPVLKYPYGKARQALELKLPLFSKERKLSFVVIDKRMDWKSAIIGGVFGNDMADCPLPEDRRNLGPLLQLVIKSGEPIHDEMKARYKTDHVLKGVCLETHFEWVYDKYNKQEAAIVFLEIEREIIRRAKVANFKHIAATNTHKATQTITRDILGYREVSAVYAANFKSPDGVLLFPGAPPDLAVMGMVLDV